MGRNSTIRISILADTNRASRALESLGTEVGGLGKILALPQVVPALAAVTAGTLELGTALGIAAGAGAVFGLSAGGIIKDMLNAQKAIDTQQTKLAGLTKGTADYAAQVKIVRTMQQSFNKEFGPAAKGYNDLGAAFTRFKDQTSGVTDKILKQAFEGVANLLPRLVPLSDAAGKAIGGLLTDLKHFTAGPGFQKFLDTLQHEGTGNITKFGHIIGNTISGLGSILSHFVGPGDKFTTSIENATKRFSVWAKSPGVSKGIQAFLDYVHSNAPAISADLVSLSSILPKLATALGGVGSVDLKAISLLLSLIASLPQGVFNVIVEGALAFAVLSKAIAVTTAASKAWVTVQALVKGAQIAWTAATEGMTAAQVELDAAMDANPIGAVVIAIAALAAGLVFAYKKSTIFRDVVNGAFAGIQKIVGTVIPFIVDFVKKHWAVLAVILGGPIGLAAVLIIKNFHRIIAVIQVLGGWAKWLWNNAFQPALHFIVGAFGVLLGTLAKVVNAFAHVPGASHLFPWAAPLASMLQTASDKADQLASKIRDIPTSKSVDVVLNVIQGVVHTTGGRVPVDPRTVNPKTLIPKTNGVIVQRTYNVNVAPTITASAYDIGEVVTQAISAFESASAV